MLQGQGDSVQKEITPSRTRPKVDEFVVFREYKSYFFEKTQLLCFPKIPRIVPEFQEISNISSWKPWNSKRNSGKSWNSKRISGKSRNSAWNSKNSKIKSFGKFSKTNSKRFWKFQWFLEFFPSDQKHTFRGLIVESSLEKLRWKLKSNALFVSISKTAVRINRVFH